MKNVMPKDINEFENLVGQYFDLKKIEGNHPTLAGMKYFCGISEKNWKDILAAKHGLDMSQYAQLSIQRLNAHYEDELVGDDVKKKNHLMFYMKATLGYRDTDTAATVQVTNNKLELNIDDEQARRIAARAIRGNGSQICEGKFNRLQHTDGQDVSGHVVS